MNNKLERVLHRVQKPSRYTGGEYNQIIKDKDRTEIRIAFCFPDTYEIGMSNLGLRIMYGILNGIEGVWCERVFAPWLDMEEEMRREKISLYGLESYDPIGDFDIIAFSIGYELSYTNVLNMLDLAGVTLRSSARGEDEPLVIAGGLSCYNPEPLADFIDLFVIGDGEDVASTLVELYKSCKKNDASKESFLLEASKLDGIYVPSQYNVEYDIGGTISKIIPSANAALPVRRRIVPDLDCSFFPVDTIVPSIGLVHDRVVLELFRGCIHGCRFCQAGYITRPMRSRTKEVLVRQGIDSICATGYDEIALLSLSTSDYADLVSLCDGLIDWCEPRKVSLSLPSLRADNFSVELMERVQKVRKSGLTFAPEAGSQRLRDVINKNLTDEDLVNTCRVAFEGGWNAVKLYFMLGLPTETDEDVLGIAELAQTILHTWRQYAKNKNRGVRITVSTSCFIPKAHTPFQWEAQITMEEYSRRVKLLKEAINSKSITYKWHCAMQGFIEAVLARGDRRLGAVIDAAWQNGARLDSWSECFSIEHWNNAFLSCGIDPSFYANRERSDEILPWSIVAAGVSDEFYEAERAAAYSGLKSPDCLAGCAGCGAC